MGITAFAACTTGKSKQSSPRQADCIGFLDEAQALAELFSKKTMTEAAFVSEGQLVPEKTLYLPLSIAHAITRVISGVVDSLTMMERMVMAHIISLANKDQPGKPIYVRKLTLANRLQLSEPSLRRYLSALQKRGWIEREQFISRAAGAQVGTLTLTKAAVDAFFQAPPESTPAKAKSADQPVFDRAKSSDASLVIPKQCLSRHHLPAGLSFTPEEAEEARKVPSPLWWLLQFMKPKGIFRLMREAKLSGTLLETVANAVRDAVPKARNAFAYLRSLLGKDRDWNFYASRAAAEQAKQVVEEQKAEIQAKRKHAATDLQGCTLLDSKTGRYLLPIGSSLLLFESKEAVKRGQHVGALPFSDAVWKHIESGRIVQVEQIKPTGTV